MGFYSSFGVAFNIKGISRDLIKRIRSEAISSGILKDDDGMPDKFNRTFDKELESFNSMGVMEFGATSDALLKFFNDYPKKKENDQFICPWEANLLRPISPMSLYHMDDIADMGLDDDDDSMSLDLLAISFSGNGYFFPMKYDEVLDFVCANKEILSFIEKINKLSICDTIEIDENKIFNDLTRLVNYNHTLIYVSEG
jgi:hypothetical protein